MRISDWSSDVCSSDLGILRFGGLTDKIHGRIQTLFQRLDLQVDGLLDIVERQGIGLERGFGELLAKRTEIGELGELVVDLLVHGWYSWVGVAGEIGRAHV